MTRRTALLLLASLGFAGCSTYVEPTKTVTTKSSVADETDDVAQMRKIVLPDDAVVAVDVGADGTTQITITIPEGHADAGTYQSTSPYLLNEVVAIQDTLGQPGVEAAITVNDAGEIVIVSLGVTGQ